jgi:adenylate kinase family enzyme
VKRVHIFGAAGTGTTTLGRALAKTSQWKHYEADDFLWLPTAPPYQQQRPREERTRQLQEALVGSPAWVLSGCINGWGEPLLPAIELAVFLRVPTEVRLRRILDRESARFGAEIAPGGRMYEQYQAFLRWTAAYDDGDLTVRSLRLHEAWLAKLSCPCLRLDGTMPTTEQLALLRESFPELSQG